MARPTAKTTRTKSGESSGVYKIAGVPVEFPYKPYGTQLAFMSQVITTLERASRQGHCNALLESPTGTGKTLSLLCAALAWQRNYKPRIDENPLVSGGGFIREPDSSGDDVMGSSSLSATADDSKRTSKKSVPTVYYASRTHSQISQVIREYRKTSYRVPMAILASKKRYCINDRVCNKQNVDEECKLLLKDPDRGCVGSKNAHKVKSHPSVRKGGSFEIHDIEDLVKVGRSIQGCPYFGAQLLAIDAHIIFCPYSYVLDPVVRRAMDLDLTGAVIIFDEAHNIEDMARDAGSFDAEEDALDRLQVELGQLSSVDKNVYQPLHDMIQGITTWMGHRKDKLEKFEFEHHFSCWTGDNALKELETAGISQQCFPVLQQCASKAIKIASDAEIDRVHLSGMSVATLDGLVSALSYFFACGGIHLIDYQLVLQRYIKRVSGSNASGWTYAFSLWCLNPSVVFKELANLSLSVILTSGTLSPMNSFASELGVQFEICMEAPHVINMESQVWAAVVSNGPDNVCLNASYKTADNYAFQDSLGASLEEICKVVPGGVLAFFPSYKLMDKLCCRWKHTGLWSRLCERKPVFVEPRGNSDDFESVLRGYYGSIHGTMKPEKVKGQNKRNLKHSVNDDLVQNNPKGEAAFLAVCRGKVSEGIDFSDENARVVVIVGIPFPNKSDIKVVMKKRYNDKYRTSKQLLSGNEWYCQQAFRALNQAAGRCIRHRTDYGAIILLDERFMGENNMANMSKWLRKSIKEYDNFSMAIKGLEKFYPEAKEKVDERYINVKKAAISNLLTNESHEKCTNISGSGSQKRITQKVKKVYRGQEKQIASSDKLMPLGNGILKKLSAAITSNIFYNPLRKEECDSLLVDSSHVKRKTFDGENGDGVIRTSVKKASRSKVKGSVNSTGSDSKLSSDTEEQHHATVEQDDNFPATADEFPDNVSHPGFMTPSVVSSKDALLPTVTPESTVGAEDILNPEFESSFSRSVNSYHQKIRRPIGLQLRRHMQMDVIGSRGDESVECSDPMNMRSSSETKCRTELAYRNSTSGIMSGSYGESRQKVPDMESLISQPASCDFFETSERGEDCFGTTMSCLSCSVCENPLGLAQEHFLVNCSFSSSSKYCLRNLLKPTFITEDSEKSLVGNDLGLVSVIISDVNSIDRQISHKKATSSPSEDIWSEEDGCVFRPVYCPSCSMSNTWLGMQVMATDSSNTHLLDKIIFLKDRVTARSHDAMSKEVSKLADSSVPAAASDPIPYKKSSCLVGCKSVGSLMAKHSKVVNCKSAVVMSVLLLFLVRLIMF
ncbi:unnamed protein product [Victoria cruziana]